ncbi:hypothetical protein OpiT1DRAFT_01282 [Opitutaceae bacterium TAV1]|nr:hypothetical protein OpiT1DRAFT_01282 [Opitutaceae bacterium TAV1]
MSTPKHTPGPWNAFRAASSICVSADEPVERIEDVAKSMYIEVFGENKVANAHLIAAAPEMLVALNTAADALVFQIERCGKDSLRATLATVCAAIAKAKGETV